MVAYRSGVSTWTLMSRRLRSRLPWACEVERCRIVCDIAWHHCRLDEGREAGLEGKGRGKQLDARYFLIAEIQFVTTVKGGADTTPAPLAVLMRKRLPSDVTSYSKKRSPV